MGEVDVLMARTVYEALLMLASAFMVLAQILLMKIRSLNLGDFRLIRHL